MQPNPIQLESIYQFNLRLPKTNLSQMLGPCQSQESRIGGDRSKPIGSSDGYPIHGSETVSISEQPFLAVFGGEDNMIRHP